MIEDDLKKRITVGIVTFNPDMDLLKKSIDCALEQTEQVYLFSNDKSLKPYNEFLNSNNLNDKVFLLGGRGNKGVSFALNSIMEAGEKAGYEWVVTMDQDSILPEGILKAYMELSDYKPNDKLALMCPQVIDRRRAYMEIKTSPKTEIIKECITSGCATRVKVWRELGGFDNWLFVDLVDNEYCKRVISAGFTIVRLNDYVLEHEFGKIEPKSERVQRFWVKVGKALHNDNFAKFSYKKHVDPKRVYYTNRNIIYANKKLRKYGKVGYENYNCKSYPGFWICFNAPSLLRADKKLSVAKAIIKGVYHGKKKRVKKWKVKSQG